MRSLAIYSYKKRVRGMRRRMRALARWAAAFSGPFPTEPRADAVAHRMRARPAAASGFRVTASICVPDLFSSEVCIYTDEAYFQSKVQPSEDENGRVTPITGRSLAREWGLVLPPGVVERGVLWDFRKSADPTDHYRSELWFYGEVG